MKIQEVKWKVKINDSNNKIQKSVLDFKMIRKCSVCVETKMNKGKKKKIHLCNQHYGH